MKTAPFLLLGLLLLSAPFAWAQTPATNAREAFVRASRLVRHGREVGGGVQGLSLERRKEILAENAPAIQLFRGSLAQSFRPRPPDPLKYVSEYAHYRNLARLMWFEGSVKADLEDFAGAVASGLDAIQLGVTIPRGDGLGALMTGIAIEAIGRRDLWGWVEKVDAATARTTVQRLESLQPRRVSLAEALVIDKQFGSGKLLRQGIHEINRREMVELVFECCSETPPKRLPDWSKERTLQEHTRWCDRQISRARKPYVPHQEPDPVFGKSALEGNLRVKTMDIAMHAAFLTTMFALRAYHVEKGDYPKTLDGLVTAKILSRIPIDPFSGKPVRYRRESTELYVLYSVGPDAKDDGGKPIVALREGGKPKYWAEAGMKGDFVAGVNTYPGKIPAR